jgi:DNA-binding NarL/FixJ family response regulator
MSDRMADPIQIVIVDDHPLFRNGVAQTLRAQPDFEVVGEGASAGDAVRLARELLPDIILLDVTMPGSGLVAAQAIAEACPVTKSVMLTVSEHEDDVAAALKAGARGYVLKGISARDLVDVLCGVAAGESYVSPALAAGLLVQLSRGEPPRRADRAGAPDPGRGGRGLEQ